MTAKFYTKKEKRDLYLKLMPVVASKLKGMTNMYNYKEIAELTGIAHPRIIQAANADYLNENTLRILLGEEVITLADLKRADLTKRDEEYLRQLLATSSPTLVARLRKLIDKLGLERTVQKLDELIKE